MLENKNILIVDDNPADLFYVRDLLEESGVSSSSIFEASCIKELFSVLEKNKIDIILLDLFLPDSYGQTTFEKIREKVNSSAVIVMSGLTDKDVALSTVKAGAQDFLLKGEFDEKLLVKTITYSIERKKNIQLLEQSEKKYRALFNENPLPLFIVNQSDLTIKRVNLETELKYGFEPKELIGHPISKILDTAIFKSYKKNKKVKQFEVRAVHFKKNKEKIITNTIISEVEIEAKKAYLVTVEDVTEKVLFEKNKMNMVSEIQDNERGFFAMELHDGMGQELVLMNIYLEGLKNNIQGIKASQDLNQLVDSVEKCIEINNSTIANTRSLTYNINPPFLDEGLINGLSAMLERLNALSKFNVICDIVKPETKDLELDSEVTYNLFRIIQEFTNNTLKHSKANTLTCVVDHDDEFIVFKLSDDGVGFKQDDNYLGYGLKNIKQRAHIYNIDLSFKTDIGEGVSLVIKAPLKQQ